MRTSSCWTQAPAPSCTERKGVPRARQPWQGKSPIESTEFGRRERRVSTPILGENAANQATHQEGAVSDLPISHSEDLNHAGGGGVGDLCDR